MTRAHTFIITALMLAACAAPATPAPNAPTATEASRLQAAPASAPTSAPTFTATPSPTPTATPILRWPTVIPVTRVPVNSSDHPTLDDFWEGRAEWKLDVADVGLPFGESDTLVGPDGRLWSYLHASDQSAGIRDVWGQPVGFPGCVTLWVSDDAGRSFNLFAPRCLTGCEANPCASLPDQIEQQQYPRVVVDEAGAYHMVYEWGGQAYLRASADGLNWSASERVEGTGIWKLSEAYCNWYQRIKPFPLLPDPNECLIGAPPGLYAEGETLYVFVGMGKSPGHMGCFSGPVAQGAAGMRLCGNNPLFTGASVYGRTDTVSAGMNPYFDFHIISSADILKVGQRYYMFYEGMRGTDQWALGLARSTQLDGAWQKFRGNPLLMDVPGNIGVGHADVLVLDGATYLYTATSDTARGRYVLEWGP
jgi:hypothetical protein